MVVKSTPLLIFFAVLCSGLLRPVLADPADSRVASTSYVNAQIADSQSRVVSQDELNTFSDALPQRLVTTSTNQEVAGTKTFTSSPIVPTPPLP